MSQNINTPYGTYAVAEVLGDLLERAANAVPQPKLAPKPKSDKPVKK